MQGHAHAQLGCLHYHHRVSCNCYVCVENTCEPHNFGPHVVSGQTDGCSDGIQLSAHTDPTCTVACDSGYSIHSGSTTVSCAVGAYQTTMGADTSYHKICKPTFQAAGGITCVGRSTIAFVSDLHGCLLQQAMWGGGAMFYIFQVSP